MIKESLKCVSLEAKDIFGAMHQVEKTDCEYTIRNSRGDINLKKFSNTFDWSLELMKLEEFYKERTQRDDFAFKCGRHLYTTNVICVTFKYSYKAFNLAGKNTYIRNGYSFKDCVFNDCVCIKGGKLIGIQTNLGVEQPVDGDVLEGCFSYNGECYEQKGQMPTIMDKSELRNYLYQNGFRCNGIEYVRYKRSAGSSRVGKCLFVNKVLINDITEWEKCGLDVVEGQELDLAGWEAYISLPMSSIIDTVQIPLNSFLVIQDYDSVFKDKVVAVEEINGKLFSSVKETDIKNSIWDGQSMMDVSLFEKYPDKGMLLLRNQFFKSCCFNTNLQKWFKDNNITSVDQLNGFTLATDISQIKIITTPSSIKYTKFGGIEKWLKTVSSIFGIVKYEKKTHYFDGRMVQAHYQLFNTLQLSLEEMQQILKPSLDYVSAIRKDPAVLRYAIKYPTEDIGDMWRPLESKNEIIFKLLGINDKFAQTKMYYDFRDDLIKSEIRNLKRGHVLVEGNYSTMMGNGLEMLKASIGKFDGSSELGIGNIHNKRFEYGKTLLCSRSPHVTVGNVLLVQNVENEIIDKYFNLTPEIVCVNAIDENVQQRLNGCDYDSDTMLITDHPLLVEAAKRHYDNFLVPTNCVTSGLKIKRYYTNADKADLDVKTSVNKIGEID